jgi:hypothetical protein
LTAKEQSKVAQPIAAIIKLVYMFFADKKGSCPGHFGFWAVK